MKQLSFEHLEKQKKAEFGTPLANRPKPNPTVTSAQASRIKPQAAEILGRLRNGPVSTRELVSIASQYNARVREIRRHLAKIGMTVDCIEGTDGNNEYRIVPLHGSKYQAKLMKKRKERPV